MTVPSPESCVPDPAPVPVQDCPYTEGDAGLVDLTDALIAARLVLAGNVHTKPVVHQLPAEVGRLNSVPPVVVVVTNQPVLPVVMAALREDLKVKMLSPTVQIRG